jgi:UDP:flavonoid glycosyltransferase YjiC (YdhE family)
MQRKNFLFCGPSLETRRETVEFPFELLPPSRRKEAKNEGAVDTSKRSDEDGEDEKESESENSHNKEGRHLVYISMGTLYRMNPLFFRVRRFHPPSLSLFGVIIILNRRVAINKTQTCFAAFKNSPHLFVMSVGKGNLGTRTTHIVHSSLCHTHSPERAENVGETPDNFIVKEYVPQPQILDRASVFISHGGMGGISEAMVSNVRTARPTS